MKYLSMLLILMLAVPCLADDPLFMWTAEKDGNTIHLLGSIHAGQSSWYPLDERIEQAYTQADTIACEINIADASMAMKISLLVMQEGMYPSGESLRDHIEPATWDTLQARVGSSPLAPMLDRMRPGLAAVTVMQGMMAEVGLDVSQGVDMHILRWAMEAERPIVSLETPADQVAILFGPDAVIDAKLLEEALQDTPADMKVVLEGLLAAWRAGDPEAMDMVYRADWIDDEQMVEFHETLLVDRNRGMAHELENRHGHWFVVVGALHLCGDEGVPALLDKAGWQVKQVR